MIKEFGDEIINDMDIYAKEVNENRAIPSIYDGLKPVQRRVLWSMYEKKMTSDKKHHGCAEIVGGCLSDYHPHGDTSVYYALARLAQPLIMQNPLIDFHGALGSLVDKPAAMRYTSARLSPFGESLLKDIELNTVEWEANYSETKRIPKYLAGTLGSLNLLFNSQRGIGVGLASNFLGVELAPVRTYIRKLLSGATDLAGDWFIPRIPGRILNAGDLGKIYSRGKGTVLNEALYHWEDRLNLIIDELPYMVDPTECKEKILKLNDERIKNIYIQGETMLIETTNRDVLDLLLEKTPLRVKHLINMVALNLHGTPRTYSAQEICEVYIKLQHKRLIAKAECLKADYQKKLHIQEGYEKVLSDIDLAIEIIKSSENKQEAMKKLCKQFSLSQEQAQAIMDITLSKLTKIGLQEVADKINELKRLIETQTEIIKTPEIRNHLIEIHLEEFPKDTHRTNLSYEISLDQAIDGEIPEGGFSFKIDSDEYTVETDGKEKDCIYFITNKGRGIKREKKSLKVGTHSLSGLLRLAEDEVVLRWFYSTELRNLLINNYFLLSAKNIKATFTNRGRKISSSIKEVKEIIER